MQGKSLLVRICAILGAVVLAASCLTPFVVFSGWEILAPLTVLAGGMLVGVPAFGMRKHRLPLFLGIALALVGPVFSAIIVWGVLGSVSASAPSFVIAGAVLYYAGLLLALYAAARLLAELFAKKIVEQAGEPVGLETPEEHVEPQAS